MKLFTRTFNSYLLSTYFMLGTPLDGESEHFKKQIIFLLSWNFYSPTDYDKVNTCDDFME